MVDSSILIASPCDSGRLPAILIWFVYQFLQFDWSKIKDLEENARGGQKKSPEVQLFCGQFFQHRLTLFWRSNWLCACLKAESYTEAEKSACWKPAFRIVAVINTVWRWSLKIRVNLLETSFNILHSCGYTIPLSNCRWKKQFLKKLCRTLNNRIIILIIIIFLIWVQFDEVSLRLDWKGWKVAYFRILWRSNIASYINYNFEETQYLILGKACLSN